MKSAFRSNFSQIQNTVPTKYPKKGKFLGRFKSREDFNLMLRFKKKKERRENPELYEAKRLKRVEAYLKKIAKES